MKKNGSHKAKLRTRGKKLSPGEVRIHPSKHPRYPWRVVFLHGGRADSKFFKTKTAAQEFKRTHEEESKKSGITEPVRPAERHALKRWRAELERVGLTLDQACKIAVEYRERTVNSIPVADLVNHYIRAQRQNWRERHLMDVQSRMGKFVDSHGHVIAASITVKLIDDWLAALPVDSPTTRAGYRTHLHALFEYALRKGLCPENPVAKAEKFKREQPKRGVLTVAEAHQLLLGADEEILPVIALGLFAGLRDSELKRLTWAQITLRDGAGGDHGVIHVDDAKGEPRIVYILPVLSAWLRPYAGSVGSVWPVNGRGRLDKAKLRAGFGSPSAVKASAQNLKVWPENALRHSFGTYHHAAFQDLARTVNQMGNTVQMAKRHYDARREKSEGEAFFGLFPARRAEADCFPQ